MPARVVGILAGFGAGTLIAAISTDLVVAFHPVRTMPGRTPTAIVCPVFGETLWTVSAYALAFGLGALVYVAAYTWRTASRGKRPAAKPAPGAGSSAARPPAEPT